MLHRLFVFSGDAPAEVDRLRFRRMIRKQMAMRQDAGPQNVAEETRWTRYVSVSVTRPSSSDLIRFRKHDLPLR